MNFNFKLMVLVFFVTLFLAVVFGMFIPLGFYYVPALIGGFMAGYFLDENFIDGMVNAGVPVGLVGIIYYLVILTVMNNLALNVMNNEFQLLSLMIGSKILFFFVYGVLGGLLGFVVRERRLIIDIIM